MKIIRNAARCRRCGDVIESRYRHDFVMCSCGAIFVDGGCEYLRRGGDREDFQDLSEASDTRRAQPEMFGLRTVGPHKNVHDYVNWLRPARVKCRDCNEEWLEGAPEEFPSTCETEGT